jgi:RimJ/RimL family protein N-acetyltransferase
VSVPDFRLEPFAPQHVPAIAEVVVDPDILRFTGVPDPPEPGFPAEWVARYERGRRDGTREAFAAIAPDGTFLGTAMAPRIDRAAREMELGYLVAPPARGRGLGTALLRAMTGWGFDEGALRLELRVSVANPASQRVAERAGYVREGVLRSLHFKGGLRDDTIIYSRLPTDPRV